jgi:hypothetical protein
MSVQEKTVVRFPTFDNLPLVEQARLYRILTEKGAEYLAWRGREEELTAAYVPHKTRPYSVSRLLRAQAQGFTISEKELESWVEWDKETGMWDRYESSDAERTREALASYHAEAIKIDPEAKTCGNAAFAPLSASSKKQTTTVESAAAKNAGNWFTRLFG